MKNNLKYKVGQKVEINFELTLEMKRNGIFAWHPLMNRALGRIVTIRDIKTHGDCYYLTFVEDEYFFWYNECWISEVIKTASGLTDFINNIQEE